MKVYVRPHKKHTVIEERRHQGHETLDSYRQFVSANGDHAETLAEVLCGLMHGCDEPFFDRDAFDYIKVSFTAGLREARRRYHKEVATDALTKPMPPK